MWRLPDQGPRFRLCDIEALRFKKKRARLIRPPQSAAEVIATLERSGLPAIAAHLRRAQALI